MSETVKHGWWLAVAIAGHGAGVSTQIGQMIPKTDHELDQWPGKSPPSRVDVLGVLPGQAPDHTLFDIFSLFLASYPAWAGWLPLAVAACAQRAGLQQLQGKEPS